MSEESGKDVFAMFMDDVGVPRAKTPTLEFRDSNGYGDVAYSTSMKSNRHVLSSNWTVHKILEPKDIRGLFLLYNKHEDERWIEWTVEDRQDDDFGKTYFQNLRSGDTTWDLSGVTVTQQSPSVSMRPITPSISSSSSSRHSSSVSYRSPRSNSGLSTASDADILGAAVPKGSMLARLSMRSPGAIDTPSPGIPIRSIGTNKRRNSSLLKKRRKSSSPSLLRAAESSARRRSTIQKSYSSQSMMSVELSPRSRFSRRNSVLSMLQDDEMNFYRTIYHNGRKDCGEDLVDKLREKNSTKRQIALMRLYHCISLIEHKAAAFRRRMNISRERESRVVVVEILNTRPRIPAGTRIAAELIYCGLSLGRFLPLRERSGSSGYEENNDLIMESPYLVGELPLTCVVRICLLRVDTQKEIGWVDVPLFHQERSDESSSSNDNERKVSVDSENSASWKSKHDRGNFVPVGGNINVLIYSSNDDNLYKGEALPEVSVRFSMRKPSKHNGAYHDFISRPQVYAFRPETMASIEEGRRLDPKRYIIKSGWVQKVKARSNGSFSKEKSRWIVLRESTISWYANQDDEKELGSWDLNGVTIRRCTDPKHNSFVSVMTGAKKTTKAQLCRRCLIVTKKDGGKSSPRSSGFFSSLKRSSKSTSRETYHYIFNPDNSGNVDVMENINSWARSIAAARDLGKLRNDKFKGYVENSPTNNTTSEMQRFRVSTQLGDRLAETLNLLPTEALWPEEKASVWANRVSICDSDPKSLLKFLESVNWLQSSKREEATRLMLQWPRPATLSLLVLLTSRFADFTVRDYAVSVFGASNMPSWLIVMLLPQLVQGLKAESFEHSSLLYFLMEQAIENFETIGLSLHWLFAVEANSASEKRLRHSCFFDRSLDRFQCLLETEDQRTLEIQRMLWALDGTFADVSRLAVSHKRSGASPSLKTKTRPVSTRQDSSNSFRLSQNSGDLETPASPFQEENQQQQSQNDGQSSMQKARTDALAQLNALAASGALSEEMVEKLKNQAQGEFWSAAKDKISKHRIIFKIGDDLRQDSVVLNTLRLMDQLWLCNDLDLKMTPYKVVPTSDNSGVIQVVPDAKTMADWFADMHGEGGLGRTQTILGSKHEQTYVYDSLRQCNPHSGNDLKYVVDTFARSLAGYCVATHILAIGDRHNDNMMMTSQGRFFHIDFGHILGHTKTKKIAGVTFDREKTTFVMTPAMKYALDKGNAFEKFRGYCRKAITILRKHTDLLLNMFLLMLPAKFAELSLQNLEVLKDRLWIHESDDEVVCAHFDKLIEKALGDGRKVLDDRFHILKHKLSSNKKKKHEIKRVQDRLNELISQDQIPNSFLFPYGFRVGKLLPDECRPLSAATKPLLLVFEAIKDDKTADPVEWFRSMDRIRKSRSDQFKHFVTSPPPELFTGDFNIGHIVSTRLSKMQSGFESLEFDGTTKKSDNRNDDDDDDENPRLSRFMKRAAPTSLVSQLTNKDSLRSHGTNNSSSSNRTKSLDLSKVGENVSDVVPSVQKRVGESASLKPKQRRVSLAEAFEKKNRRNSSSSSSLLDDNEDDFILEAIRRIRVLHVGKWGKALPVLKSMFEAADMSECAEETPVSTNSISRLVLKLFRMKQVKRLSL